MKTGHSIRAICLVAVTACMIAGAAWAQSALSNAYSYLSAASTNSTLVFPGPSLLMGGVIVNTTSTEYFLKIYDTVSAPTCGTGTPKLRYPIPSNSNGGGAFYLSPDSQKFAFGVGFCLTGAIGDSDTTAAAAGVAINLAVTPQ